MTTAARAIKSQNPLFLQPLQRTASDGLEVLEKKWVLKLDADEIDKEKLETVFGRRCTFQVFTQSSSVTLSECTPLILVRCWRRKVSFGSSNELDSEKLETILNSSLL